MDSSYAGRYLSRRALLSMMGGAATVSLVPTSLMGPSIALGATASDDGLTRGSPLDANIDPRVILNFIDSVFAHELDLHSFMLYRHGKVVAEGWSWPYASHRPHIMHSLTKSVTACAVGLAINEGHFDVDDKVVSFFDEELPATINDHLAAMTVRDLLTMQGGHAESVSGSVFRPIKTSWVEEFFKIPVVNPPGTEYLYSSALSFMLSAIVTKTTGLAARDYLEPRMFEPLGITGLDWGASPAGISSGGNGLTWKTADSLKLGILHLNNGQWDGQQILPADWIAEATRAQVPGGHYGYQWWVEQPADAYYAVGAFGQYSVVFPKHDAVLAITSGVPRGSPLEQLIFEHFPAAFGDSDYRASAATNTELQDRLNNLRLVPQARYTVSPIMDRVSGKTYVIEPNDDDVTAVVLEFTGDSAIYKMSDHRGTHLIEVGLHDWIESETGMTGNKLHHQYQSDDMKVVAHGQWWDDHTFEMTWQFVETAWVDSVRVQFYNDRISIDRRTNANYAPMVAPTLRGKMN